MKILTSDPSLEEYSRDAGFIRIRPNAVWIAETEDEVVESVKGAVARGSVLTARGSGTSIPTQSVGPGIVLLQDRRRATIRGNHVSCEPALVKAELNGLLERTGQWMPVDPSSYRACSIGGMAANNSSGTRSLKYGSTAEYVTELRAVLPESGLSVVRPIPLEDALRAGGETAEVAGLLVGNQAAIAREAPAVTKNSSGYRLERVVHDGILDLPKLFVGSEGTLGVLTEVGLKASERPRSSALAVLECSLAELDDVVSRLREHLPSALELVDKSIFRKTGSETRLKNLSRSDEDYLVFCELDGSESEVEGSIEALAADRRISGSDPLLITDRAESAAAWAVRNDTLTIAAEMRKGNRVPLPGVEDLVVPPQHLGRLLKFVIGAFEERGLDYICYGHAGDANLHTRPLLDPESANDLRTLTEIMEECFEEVWRMGGSITGEHGDGMLRAPYVRLQYPETYAIMQEIKRIYDPKSLMNPGVKIV